MSTMTKTQVQKAIHGILIVAMLLSLALVGGSPAVAQESYIVQSTDMSLAARLVRAHGGQVTAELAIIQGVAANLTAEAAQAVKAHPAITSVFADQSVEVADRGAWEQRKNAARPETDYPDVVGADVVWQEGVTGKGITVAIVDSGLEMHPGLIKGIDGKLSGRIVGWKDFVDGRPIPNDPNGHGTHVAGVVADSLVGADGEWNGVAPGVSLVGVRVLDKQGGSTYARVIQGIDWVVSNKDKYNIRILNLSLVAPVQTPYWADPLNQAVMKAWEAGIVVVAAAGNSGPDPLSISVPGNNPYVITVGAFTDNYTPDNWGDDYITPFSATGPTYDAFVKPDVVAPGGHIVSTMLPSSYYGKLYKENKVNGLYYSLAGTSQSAAVVSGVVALTLAENPTLTPDEVKFRIQFTSFPWVDPATGQAQYSIWQQGHGRVSAPDAVFQPIQGEANVGMDIAADLAGEVHYQGYTIYNEETGEFQLGNGLEDWNDGYAHWDGTLGTWIGTIGNWAGYTTWYGTLGTWAGTIGTWSGTMGTWVGTIGSWAGTMGTWVGTIGTWSGTIGTWSGTIGTWSGTMGTWSGTIGNWSGTMGTWSGTIGNWSGTMGSWAGNFSDWTGSVSPERWVEPEP